MLNPNDNVENPKDYLTKIGETIKSLVIPETYLGGITTLMARSTELNKSFLDGRGRIEQMQIAIADAIPEVVRLGGTVSETVAAMGEIAEASHRNLIAQEETVGELYGASQLLNQSVSTLTSSFLDVGIAIDDIGENLEETIYYVQSLGLNAKLVTSDVTDNLDKLQRYQFEGGIRGLAKMAAQAAMLRVEMSETFRFADKVLTPEGAIEVAAAFQRLGVAAGSLVDPFQLMNQSINDPSGLQTSLANAAKSFVYFSKEAGQFKINPEGVLRLREMEEAAGLSQGTLTKMGIAAAEMGERMKQISSAGLKFENEEDQQFLANISEMGKDGVYRVTLEDGTKVDINELNQQQFDRLIEREKDRPKTIEDMTRAQMDISKLVQKDVETLRDKIVYGTVTLGPIPGLTEDFRDVTKAITEVISGQAKEGFNYKTSDVRSELGGVFKSLTDAMKGPGDMVEKFGKWAEGVGEIDMGEKMTTLVNNFIDAAKSGLKTSSDNQQAISDVLSQFEKKVVNPLQTQDEKYRGQKFLEGTSPVDQKKISSTGELSKTTPVLKGDIDMNINHTFPPEFKNLSQSEQLKVFDEYLKQQMRSQDFKNYFFQLIDSRNSSTVKRQ